MNMRTGDNDNLLRAKILDMIDLSDRYFSPRFSQFLDERQCADSERILSELHFHSYKFFGGFPQSKRKILGIYPEYLSADEGDFPIVPIEFRYRVSDKLSHRDFLGALMSQQIKREMLGDILVNDGCTVVFIYQSVSDFILNNVEKIGSVGVKSSISKQTDFQAVEEFEEITGTVSSLRLDAVSALALRLSRQKVMELIKSDGIEVNYTKIYSGDFLLKEKDIFSVRGFGKFILEHIGGLSKKDRIHITIKKYI